jgi:hypothetical protein
MGNSSSQNNSAIDLNLIDKIATTYILSMNFQDMVDMTTEAGCNKMVILTADIFNKYMTTLDIKNLYQKKIENLVVFPEDLKKSVDMQDQNEKNKMCKELAKFYVQIAHLFAAIISSVNPKYEYVKDGTQISINIMEKKEIPEELQKSVSIVLSKNFCSEREKALSKNSNLDNKGELTVGVPYCSLDESLTKFIDTSGIRELEDLFKDTYDTSTGVFSMSEKSKKNYQEIVQSFYNLLYNKKNNSIESFSDLKYPEYKEERGCKDDELLKAVGINNKKKKGQEDNTFKPPFMEKYSGTNSGLFKEFKDNIELMKQNTEANTQKVFQKLNEIFDTSQDPVVLRPTITRESINKLIQETRNLLIQLYYNCEKDFQKGLELFRNIVNEEIIKDVAQDIKSLDETSQQLIEDSPPSP